MESSPYAEDPRRRFKYQSLMQDFEELFKETEATKDKLQMMEKKKSTLLAEVRFLRRRYKYLMRTRSPNPSSELNYVQPQKVVAGSKNVWKEQNFSRNNASLRRPHPRFDLNQKGKIQTERGINLIIPAPFFDMNKKQKAYNGVRNSLTIPDLNQKGRFYGGKEATAQNRTPIFDLNQISMEEVELRANSEGMRIEETKISSMRGGSDEQHSDVKFSVCRNVGNGSSQAGKRKISWQDQVALRV